ncbi:hypothetical protein ACFY97_18750 [Streptomyces klenkii]|uniref:hypothetical protein n=1 Tax=Streptomyces klenkii TaxID=1420899 RepID=UPI0036E2F68B
MGFIDAIDNLLTDVRIGVQASREAKRFAQGLRKGDTLYSIQDFTLPVIGATQLVVEHKLDGVDGLISGEPMCGPDTVTALWRKHPTLSKKRPRHLQTLDEYVESGSWVIDGLDDRAAKAHAREMREALERVRQMVGAGR